LQARGRPGKGLLFLRVGMYTREGKNKYDLMLPAGSYVTKYSFDAERRTTGLYIQEFYAHAEERGYMCSRPLLMVEKSYLSLFTPDQLHYELLSYLSNPEKVD
jgi:hypothetical protein